MPPDSAVHLRQFGHDVLTSRDLSREQADDAEHLLAAAHRGRVLVTRDKGYRSLHLAWRLWSAYWQVQPMPQHAGILIVDSHWSPQRVGQEVDQWLGTVWPLGNVLYRFEAMPAGAPAWVRY